MSSTLSEEEGEVREEVEGDEKRRRDYSRD
jgi:hypothetical protein